MSASQITNPTLDMSAHTNYNNNLHSPSVQRTAILNCIHTLANIRSTGMAITKAAILQSNAMTNSEPIMNQLLLQRSRTLSDVETLAHEVKELVLNTLEMRTQRIITNLVQLLSEIREEGNEEDIIASRILIKSYLSPNPVLVPETPRSPSPVLVPPPDEMDEDKENIDPIRIGAEFRRLSAFLQSIKPPTNAGIFDPPANYTTLASQGEQDPGYWKMILDKGM